MRSLLAALVLMFVCGSAKADLVYDWSYSAIYICGGGPGCAQVGLGPDSAAFGSGTFTVGDDAGLGVGGILQPSDLPKIISYTPATTDNYSLFSVVNMGGAPVYVHVDFLPFPVGVWANAFVHYDFDHYEVGTAAAAPEPSTWAMLLIGFAGVGYMSVRRRNRYGIAATF
jgi:hypothetical protein